MNTKNNKKLKIGIIGHGFVGKATDWGFHKNNTKFIVDPILNTSIEDLAEFNPDICFVCVPTPMSINGDQDSSIIEKVIKDLAISCPRSIKVVKSTVLPSVLRKLVESDKKIIYNPEFLREKHANFDFENSELIIFGGNKDISMKVSDIYRNNSRCKNQNYIFTDLETASFIKYSINSYLASKVLFFNELHSVFEKLGVKDNWKTISEIISRDKRIGASHMAVPGHDGKKGFGGACLPKDTLALIKFAESLEVELTSLKTTIKSNNKIRSQYETLDSRETEQNISFDDKI